MTRQDDDRPSGFCQKVSKRHTQKAAAPRNHNRPGTDGNAHGECLDTSFPKSLSSNNRKTAAELTCDEPNGGATRAWWNSCLPVRLKAGSTRLVGKNQLATFLDYITREMPGSRFFITKTPRHQGQAQIRRLKRGSQFASISNGFRTMSDDGNTRVSFRQTKSPWSPDDAKGTRRQNGEPALAKPRWSYPASATAPIRSG